MPNKYLAAIGAFLAVHLTAAYLWWLSGAEVNRGSSLLFTGFLSLWVGGWVSYSILVLWEDKKE